MVMTESRRQTIIRIDDALYDALAAWAQEEDRSVNQHMIRLLRQAAIDAGRWPRSHTRPLRCAEDDGA